MSNKFAKRNDGREVNHWSVWIADWSVYLRAAGRSPGTVRLRRYWLTRFAESADAGPGVIDGDGVAAWLANGDWSPNTRCSARASVRAFFGWVHESGRRADNPTAALLTIAPTPGLAAPVP